MVDNTVRHYHVDDVRAIVRRVLERRRFADTVSHEELVDTAREFGIGCEDLDAAIREMDTERATRDACQAWRRRRREKFFDHLRTYALVNGFFFLIDVATGGGGWSYCPMVCWGFFLLIDAAEALFPSKRDVDRGARSLLRRHPETGAAPASASR